MVASCSTEYCGWSLDAMMCRTDEDITFFGWETDKDEFHQPQFHMTEVLDEAWPLVCAPL